MTSETFGAAALAAGQAACALLGWRAPEFWAATPAELAMALEGLASPGEAQPLTTGEMAALESGTEGTGDGRRA